MPREYQVTVSPYMQWEPKLDYSKHARKIVKDILGLKKGENVTIEAWQHQLNFANEIKFQARLLGANVVLLTEEEKDHWRLFNENREKVMGQVGKHEWSLIENSDAYIFFQGPGDLEREIATEPKRRSTSTAYNYSWYQRATKARLRGVRIGTAYATPSRAKVYGFDHVKWYKNALDALDVDYEQIEAKAKRVGKSLRGKSIEISSQNGSRLKLKMTRALPHVYSGLMKKNPAYNDFSVLMTVPGGEIDLVPVPTSVEGRVRFDCPVLRMGKKVEGLKWTFKGGKLARYSASKNQAAFKKPYDSAKGEKDRVGVLAIGLNPKLAYGFNNDLSVEGALSIGLGSFGEGDKNKTDFAFYATLSKGTLRAGKKTIIKSGKLL
ncbi:MAG: aminopeptidase [Nitrososphaerales archaeon]